MAASPKEKVGTKETPHLSASLTNPFFFLRISRTWIIVKTKTNTLNKQVNKNTNTQKTTKNKQENTDSFSPTSPLSQLRDSGAPPGTSTAAWPPSLLDNTLSIPFWIGKILMGSRTNVEKVMWQTFVAATDPVVDQRSLKKGIQNICSNTSKWGVIPGNTLKIFF